MRGMVFVVTLFLIFSLGYSEEKIDFDKDIYPILKSRCFKCHHEKKQKGDFDFLSRENVLKGGESGEVVKIGKSSESLLVKLIESEDEDEFMPPKGDRLTKEEISKIKKWIDQGLVWGKNSEKKEEDNNSENDE